MLEMDSGIITMEKLAVKREFKTNYALYINRLMVYNKIIIRKYL
jgi:hypothetical protein